MSSTFGEKKRTPGPFDREGIVDGPFFLALIHTHPSKPADEKLSAGLPHLALQSANVALMIMK